MGKLLPLSPVPLYSQLKELLRGRILDGTYSPHSRMPSENELGQVFGVSRITVRQALGDLQKEGLIFKIHGKGTFALRDAVRKELKANRFVKSYRNGVFGEGDNGVTVVELS